MYSFPSSLPKPQLSGFSVKQKLPIARSKMSDGLARQRRLYSQQPSQVSVSFVFDGVQLKAFEQFLNQVNFGAWFKMPVLASVGLVSKKARFVKDLSKNYTGKYWKITAALEYIDE